MTRPQSGILPESNTHTLFLTLLVASGDASAAPVRRQLAAVPDLTAALAECDPDAGLVSVVGIGAAAWDRLYPQSRPKQLRPFTPLEDATRAAPSTPADALLHLRSERGDLNFELARRIMRGLAGAAVVVEEINGFRYMDSRDLIGFVDGTENPTGDARADVALVADEDADFAGGSYISVQRYIHDLPKWEELPISEQEQIIARTKADNVEFTKDVRPPTSHLGRVAIKEDGKSIEILRHSMPYGTTSEHGLYFAAYARTPDNFDKMLKRMIVADARGHYDHLMGYTRAVTGASFFAPSREFLDFSN